MKRRPAERRRTVGAGERVDATTLDETGIRPDALTHQHAALHALEDLGMHHHAAARLAEPDPAAAPQASAAAETPDMKPRSARQPCGTLVVMELDCDLRLYRDVAVNGLPRFNATWQPTGGDPLVAATLQEACAAAALPSSERVPAG